MYDVESAGYGTMQAPGRNSPAAVRRSEEGIVQYLASLGKWEEIWVTPVFKHMHAKNSALIDFEHRYNMCKLNFITNEVKGPGKQSKVRVVRLEKEVVDFHLELAKQSGTNLEDVKVGTIDVVVYAQEMKPATTFSLTLGTDTYADLKNGKWKRGAELQKRVSLVVVSRPGVPYTCTAEEAKDKRISFHNVPNLTDISSTAVRYSTDVKYLRQALEPQVLNYIRSHKLYSFGKRAGAGYYFRQGLRFTILASLVAVGVFLVWKYFGPDAAAPQMDAATLTSSDVSP